MRAARAVRLLLLTIGLALAAMPAEAVVILDSTWAREGWRTGQ